MRALQARLAAHGVSFGHWTFLRILWERDGLTQRELSAEAGEPGERLHVARAAQGDKDELQRRFPSITRSTRRVAARSAALAPRTAMALTSSAR